MRTKGNRRLCRLSKSTLSST